MSNKNIRRGPTAGGAPQDFVNRPGASDCYVDGSTGFLVVGSAASGATKKTYVDIDSVQTLSNKTLAISSFAVLDDVRQTLGTSLDDIFIHDTAGTAAGADTAVAGVVIGTGAHHSTAANSLIISNITASGDILIVANRGGNSEEYLMIDSSAGVLYLGGYQGGISLGLITAAPAPDGGAVHIWDGTAGSVTAKTGSRLVIETDQTTNALNFLGPTTTTIQGIYFGDTTNDRASILYGHDTDLFSIAAGGAATATLSATHNVLGVAGRVLDFITVTTTATDSNQTYTAAQMLGGVIIRSHGGARTDSSDTAANIIAAIPGQVVGSSFLFTIDVTGAGSVAFTGANTGITYVGDATAIATTKSATFRVLVTGAASVSIYRVTGP